MILKTKKKIKKKIKFNFFNNLKNTFAFLFFLQILVIIFISFWYLNNPVKNIYPPSKILNMINQKSKNLFGFEIRNVNSYIEVYIKGAYYSIFKPKIDKIDININQKNVLELEFQRQNRYKNLSSDSEIKKKLNKYVNATIIFDGEKIPVKIRVKGDRRIHFDKVQSTSYKIDVRKDQKIWGLEEFSLQKPIVRNYAYEYIFHKLHHELGNISLKYKLVELSINGLSYGIYSIEEGFSKELIERHSKRNGPIFGIRDDISREYPNVVYDSYSRDYWLNNDIELLNSGYGILNLIKDNNSEAKKFIDWDAWAKFFAVSDLVEAYHGALAKSVRVYYNPVSGKIEPITFDGHHGTADFSNFIILDFLNEKSSCSWICNEREWFLRFLMNDKNEIREEFIDPYIKYLKKITSDEFLNNFKKKYSNEINSLNNFFYSDFSKHDNIFWEGIFPYVYDKNYLKNRAKEINQKLNFNDTSSLIFSKKDNKLKVNVPLNSLPFKVLSDCENQQSNKIILWVHKTREFLWPEKCQNIVVQTITNKNEYITLFDNPTLNTYLPTNFEKFVPLNNILIGKVIDKTFFPSNKELVIDQNTILPKELNLELKDGQNIILKNGATLIFYGDVNINPDEKNKVNIIGVEPNYGSIISLNNKIQIKNSKIINLNSPLINGYTFFAGMNIFNSDVHLQNVSFENSLSEDSLNLIDSKSNINNLSFFNSKSDALDIDGGVLNISKLYCNKIGNDCLDFSNAIINGDDIFTTEVMDKSISIGEKSKVNISNVKINNSEIGLAVKDNSKAILKSVEIKNSKLPIAVFVKKNEYGPAKLNIENFILKDSEKIYLVDDKSELTINGKQIYGTEKGSVIESYLYGNIYGKATIR